MTVKRLVALDMPASVEFAIHVRNAWNAGDAVFPIDQRLPQVAKDSLVEQFKPSVLIDGTGSIVTLANSEPTEEHDALVIATSGSTGNPKGVVHTHSTLLDRASAGSEFDKLTSSEEVLAYLPPAWIGQNIFSYAQWLCCGYVVNCPESAATINIDLKEIGPTYYFAPPRVFEGLLTAVMIRMEDAGTLKRKMFEACMSVAKRVGPALMDGEAVGTIDKIKYALGNLLVYGPLRNNLGFSRVRVAYTAGEAIGPDLFTFYRSIGINMKQLYGSTETAVFVCVQPDNQARADTVGVPIRGVQIKVADNGEILVKGPMLLKAYYKRPDATAEAIDAAGWMHTGDLASMNDEGYVCIAGRNKDMIIRGGENIYPRELEEFFFTHPAVADVQVIGIPCSRYGEEIVAWIKFHPGHSATEQELQAWCKERIAHFKTPRYFKFVEEFPMTVTGKIQKFRMREISIEELRSNEG